jgi:hypothetical protein
MRSWLPQYLMRVRHFAASDRQHCFLREFFWYALSNQVA